MARMTRARLRHAEPLADYKMKLIFQNGSIFSVDFKPFFTECPGLVPLRDKAAFEKAKVDEWGWTLEWPELDIQIGADTLWLDAQAQNAPDENT